MPDVNLITELINNMGFPIVMVGYFVYDKYKTTNKLINVIENNNTILNKLLMKMGHGELADEMDEDIV